MLVQIEVKSVHRLTPSDLETLRATASFDNIGIAVQRPVRRDVMSIDPTVVDLTMKFVGGTTVAAAVTGAFKCLAEWLRGRAQISKIRVGEVEISFPASQLDGDFRATVEEIIKVAARGNSENILADLQLKLRDGSQTDDGNC